MTLKDLTDFRILLLVSIALGLVSGLLVFSLLQDEAEDSFCKGLEEQVRENQSFNGTVACFEPSESGFDLPEEIRDRADIRCVCRLVQNGEIRYIPTAYESG